MVDAVNSIPATILPFPSGNGLTRILDDWQSIAVALRFATLFRGMSAGQAEKVRIVLEGEDGADPLADALAEMSAAVVALRGAAAELAGVDRLLASAADRVLAEAGI